MTNFTPESNDVFSPWDGLTASALEALGVVPNLTARLLHLPASACPHPVWAVFGRLYVRRCELTYQLLRDYECECRFPPDEDSGRHALRR